MLRARSSVTRVSGCGGGASSPAASVGSQAEPQPSSSLRATRFSKRPPTYDAAPRPLGAPCLANAALPSSRIGLGSRAWVAAAATSVPPRHDAEPAFMFDQMQHSLPPFPAIQYTHLSLTR